MVLIGFSGRLPVFDITPVMGYHGSGSERGDASLFRLFEERAMPPLPWKKKVFLGTSGFQFDDWAGSVYPPNLPKDARLSYYRETLGFQALELNYTYYRLPVPRTAVGILKKVDPGFTFVVRSHREMTHEIWEDAQRTRPKDNAEIFDTFRAGVEPFLGAGQLGCLLLQFPTFFQPSRLHLEYLRRCRERLAGYPLVVEFRHRAWDHPRAFSFLKRWGLGYCVVDEPPLPPLMPLVVRTTAATAYLRLHGRNRNWFRASKEERYHYDYTAEELERFIPVIQRLATEADRVFVFFNNCHAGLAVKNALVLRGLLEKAG